MHSGWSGNYKINQPRKADALVRAPLRFALVTMNVRIIIASLFLLSVDTEAKGTWGEDRFPAHFSLFLQKETDLYPYGIDHPCGKKLSLSGFDIPVGSNLFSVDWVYEISSDGQILGKWPTPVDATPVAINGENLLLKVFEPENRFVVVTRSGKIWNALYVESEDIPSVSSTDCPVEGGENERYDYCVHLQDHKTKQAKIVTAQFVCT